MRSRFISLVFLTLITLFPITSLAFGPIMPGHGPAYIEDDVYYDDEPVVIHRPVLPVVKSLVKKALATPVPKPATPANTQLIKSFYEDVWVKNDSDAIYRYLDKNVNGYINGNHYYVADFDKKMKRFQANNKDITLTFKQLFQQNNLVAVNVTICGTRLDINKKICIPNIGIYTITNNKITEFEVNAPYSKPQTPVKAASDSSWSSSILATIRNWI